MVRKVYAGRGESGQATVEFAIIIPLLLLLVVGIFEFGKAFNYWIDVNHLSNEGDRWAAVDWVPAHGSTPAGPMDTCQKLREFLMSQMSTGELNDAVTGQPGDLAKNITVKVLGSGQHRNPQIGDPVKVAIQAPGYKIASLGAFDFGTVTLGGSSTMRLEQAPSWAGTFVDVDAQNWEFVCSS